jgi:hypothetical protein
MEIMLDKDSMRKTSAICSLLLTFGMSILLIGCEPPAKPPAKPAVKPAAKSSGGGSTTGGGAEVPAAPAQGEPETPKAANP